MRRVESFESDQNAKLDQRVAELKKREAHHKRTISTQIERLKQLRKQLEEQKMHQKRMLLFARQTTLEVKVKKLVLVPN